VLRELIREMIGEAREGFMCVGGEEKEWSAESESEMMRNDPFV